MNMIETILMTPLGLTSAFTAAALIIILSGSKISLYGDALAKRTGLGSGLVGLLFLGAITSLPELAVSSAAAFGEGIQGRPASGANLALGNMLGSNLFNLMILVLLDGITHKNSLWSKVNKLHGKDSSFGLVLLAVLAIGFGFARWNTTQIAILGTGLATPLLLIVYIYLLVSHRENEETTPEKAEEKNDEALLNQSAIRFYSVLLLLTTVIISAGIALSLLGARMALPLDQGGFGLGQTLIGTIFLAVATSLPELVLCVAATRRGFFDMALGNIFGSNMFNLLIVFVADIALRGASLLSLASSQHLLTMAAVAILTAISILNLKQHSARRWLLLSPGSWLMLVFYILFLIWTV